MSEETLAMERAFADALARENLSSEALKRWAHCRSSHRFMAYHGKQLVTYRLEDSKPTDLVTHTCKQLSVDLYTGFTSEWETTEGGFYIATNAPREIQASTFLWHPFSSCVQFAEYKLRRNIRFSLCYKTRHNPKTRIEGETYILERSVFEDVFKGF
jgi:hypothetical protein